MELDALGQAITSVQTLLQLGVRDVAGDDQRSSERKTGLHTMLGQYRPNFIHSLVEVNLHEISGVGFGDFRKVFGRVGLESLDEDAWTSNMSMSRQAAMGHVNS